MNQYRYQLEQGMLAQMQDTPYAQISVTDLCLNVGCSRKAFYRYFGGKTGCLDSAIDRVFQEFDNYSIPAETGKSEYPADLLRYLYYWREQRSLLNVLLRDGLSGKLLERAISYIANHKHESMCWLRSDDSEYAESILLFSCCGIMAIILKWHHDGYTESPEKIATILTQLLTQPLIADPGPVVD